MPRKDLKWRRVYESLRNRILTMQPGEPLGKTIMELADDYQVNEKTIRRALVILKSSRMLIAKPRTGMFVHPQRAQDNADNPIIAFISKNPRTTPSITSRMYEWVKKSVADRINVAKISLDDFTDLLPMVKDGFLKGALISYYYPDSDLESILRTLVKYRVPVCTIDNDVNGVDSVVLNNHEIGRQIARLLFSHASLKRILLLRRYYYAQPEYERELGIEDYLTEHRIPHSRFTWMSHDYDIGTHSDKWRKPRMAEFLKAGMAFDGVFIHSPFYLDTLLNDIDAAGLPMPFIATVALQKELKDADVAGITISW